MTPQKKKPAWLSVSTCVPVMPEQKERDKEKIQEKKPFQEVSHRVVTNLISKGIEHKVHSYGNKGVGLKRI